MDTRPPFPPFTYDTAMEKVQRAEDAWNTRDPEREFNRHAHVLTSFKVESNHCILSDAVEKTVRPETQPSWLAELNSITRTHNTD